MTEICAHSSFSWIPVKCTLLTGAEGGCGCGAGGRGIWLHGIYIHIGQKERKVPWPVPGEGIGSLRRAEDHKAQPSFWLQEVQAPVEDNSYQLTPFPMVPETWAAGTSAAVCFYLSFSVTPPPPCDPLEEHTPHPSTHSDSSHWLREGEGSGSGECWRCAVLA